MVHVPTAPSLVRIEVVLVNAGTEGRKANKRSIKCQRGVLVPMHAAHVCSPCRHTYEMRFAAALHPTMIVGA
jgi:hypothetical protein